MDATQWIGRSGDPTAIAAIREQSLRSAVTLAESLHTNLVARHGADADTREAAIVAVFDEAHAYWTVERYGAGCATEADAREIADGLAAHLAEHAPGIVWGLLPADTRRAVHHEVVADMIGETD